jgi:ferrous iron transport protein A
VKTPASPSSAVATSLPTLADLRTGEEGTVAELVGVEGMTGEQATVLVARLRDLGFVPGAACRIVARMWPGGDPIAVRVGGSTFALRRAEAAAIRLLRWDEHPMIQALQSDRGRAHQA